MCAHKDNFYHPKTPSILPSSAWWPHAFYERGDMLLVCNVPLPCDQREVWVDVGYWIIYCVSDS